MKNRFMFFITAMLLMVAVGSRSQTVNEIFKNSGIWAEYGQPVSPQSSPQFKGRLSNIYWRDIELAPGQWDWTIFDDEITRHAADNMPLIFMVYTKQYAPEWLFSNGVPKVTETDAKGNVSGYSPYYLDEEYNFYFKRMITEVRKHVEQMDAGVRNNIIGVQACFGSTGDRIAYKGAVPKQYEITDAQFDSLFKVYSLYYYNEYKDVTPAITLMTNADYQDRAQYDWINENCPGGWMKCPTMGKSFQMNMEADKMDWLYDRLNKPQQGKYVKARCEISGDNLDAAWWTKKKYKNFFTVMTYDIYWGLDWPNMRVDMLTDPKFDSAFRFFNKYAGQIVPGLATNAMCALKDVLDASDTQRFPEATYGTAEKKNQTRYINIYNAYSSYGAKLEDLSIIGGTEYECIEATGTNDVGWRLLPGNYERYLHQIDANSTSTGYWNVDDENQDAMYGRFARGFELAKGKDALYFDVEDGFLRNAPLNGGYPVTIEVTYYDEGTGCWRLYYDSKISKNKASVSVTCGNTKTWKKKTVTLTDAYFGNRGVRGSDFYIKSTGTGDVKFSVVELSRPAQSATGFVVSTIPAFDTVCFNSTEAPKSFVLNAANLSGTEVQVGPLTGYTFSTSANGPYSDSLIYSNYGTEIHSTIYVKINTETQGNFAGNIIVSGGGVKSAFVYAKGTVLNTSPTLNANVVTISCYNKKDGSIDLQPVGGVGPHTYKWTNSVQQYWSATTEDISDLMVADYTVVVNSSAGCSVTKKFSITQPDILVTSVSLDSAIKCKNGVTTIKVTATGGTMPYTGAGTLTVGSGFQSYTVTDARGCSDPQGFSVTNGTVLIANPGFITGSTTVAKSQAGLVYSVKTPVAGCKYIWTVPADAVITAGQNTSSITVNWGLSAGAIKVKAQNECGTSGETSKAVSLSTKVSMQMGSSVESTTESGTEKLKTRPMTVTPNPAKDIATLQFYAEDNFRYSVQVVALTGETLLVKRGVAAPGSNIEKLDVQKFVTGQYFVILMNDKGEKQTLKLMKQ